MINEAEADRLVQMGIDKLGGILPKPINIMFGNGKTENGQRILSLEIEEIGNEPLLFLMVPELNPVMIIGKAQLKKSPAVLKRCLASRCRAESTGSQDTGTTNDGISWPDETDNLTGKCKERSEGPEEAESLRTTDTSSNISVRSDKAESLKATQMMEEEVFRAARAEQAREELPTLFSRRSDGRLVVSCPVLENAAVRPMIAAPRNRSGVDNNIIQHLVEKLVAEGKVEKVPNGYAFLVHELVLVDKLKD